MSRQEKRLAWYWLLIGSFTISLVLPSHGWSQAAIQGIVTDDLTGQPLPGATVVLEQGGAELRSETTDRNGLFQITQLGPGSYEVRIIAFGYTPLHETVVLDSGQRFTMNRGLARSPLQIEGIDVAGQGPGAVRRELGGQTITARDLGRIPTPAASGDIVTYLQTMPGVVATGDRGGQLFVRGGTPSENMVLMDGMMIYQPFHITGFFSVFPEDLVDRAEFFPGGFGPQYNGRVASVLDVRMRDGSRSGRAVSASVSPFLAEVLAEGPIRRVGTQVSYIASARRSLIEETAPWLLREEQPVRFNSYYFRLSSLGDDGGSRCSLTAMRSSDWGGLDPQDEQSRVRWKNLLIGSRCASLAGDVFIDARAGYSHLSSDAVVRGTSELSSTVGRIFLEGDVSRAFGHVRMNFGGFTHFKDTNYEFLELFSERGRATGWAGLGMYAEATVPLGRRIKVLPGATFSWYPQTYAPGIEPRLRASWQPRGRADEELSGALGLYTQRLAGIADRRDASSIFTAWMPTPEDVPIRALHAQGSWQQSLGAGFSWSVDGYYRRMDNLSVATWSPIATFTTKLSLADGRIHGADGRVEYRRRAFYGFAGYGYSRTVYETTQEDFGSWYGEPTQVYHPSHDRRHQGNLLASLQLGRSALAARWEFGSGFPFTRPIGFDEFFDFRGDVPDLTWTFGETRVLLDRPYNARLPSTHRLDVSAERPIELGRVEVLLQAGIINAYGRRNIFYYDVFTNRRLDQLPFAPYLSVKLQPRDGSTR